jgi:hypothetical protein
MDPFSSFDPATAFRQRMREAGQPRESAERLIAEGAQMFKEAHERTAGRRYSFVRTIDCARFGRRFDGIEGPRGS